ncbi:prepronociceptin-like [Coregonus clupeaformis]|uniref:prepronociceptin-like n=1 Tax=Coregonus clupeaformis TaxID=59861 RepID=UPI001BE124B3|nr:prepronociceptin-like [Coregonus clupeaformis]
MKWSLWSLLLLLRLCLPGLSDCQGDCLACGLLIPNPQSQSQQQAFNTLVCLLECDGQVFPALTWELCQRATLQHYPLPPDGGAVSKRAEEKRSLNLGPVDLESDGEMLYSAAMERYQQDGADQEDETLERRDAQYDSSPLGSTGEGDSLAMGLENREEEENEEEVRRNGQGEGGDEEEDAVVQLTKRFGGFLKGRHGYRKLIGGPVGKTLQKRLGGFIGIRKSARKWNNQKRVSQLLRQYLGMTSSRAPGRGVGRFTNPAQGVRRLPSRL